MPAAAMPAAAALTAATTVMRSESMRACGDAGAALSMQGASGGGAGLRPISSAMMSACCGLCAVASIVPSRIARAPRARDDAIMQCWLNARDRSGGQPPSQPGRAASIDGMLRCWAGTVQEYSYDTRYMYGEWQQIFINK
eukprot:SAG31_NODE_8695_length_1405_cov_1.044410_2_plen_140_part_00